MKELLDGRERFREVFGKVPIGMVLEDAEGRLLESNAAFAKTLGYDEEELRDVARGTTLDVSRVEVRPAGGEEDAKLYGELVRGDREGFRVEKRYVRKDGQVVWGRLSATLYGGEDGETDGEPLVVGIVEDVDERRRAEEDLNVSERRFRAVVEQSPISIHLFTPDGRSLVTNAAWNELWNVEEVPEGSDIFEDEHLASTGLLPYVRESVARSIPVDTPPLLFDPAWVGREGRVRWLEASIYPVRDEAGRASEMVLTVEDVTRRVRVEEELKLKNRAIDASSNGIIITGTPEKDHPIVYYNPALERITGYSSEEVLGCNPRFLQGSDKAQPDAKRLRAALEEGREWFGVLRNYRKGGTLFWNEMYVAPVRDEDGQVTNFVGVQNDVTGRKALEEQLAYQAFHDSLTGLPNRALFLDRLKHALERARRHGNRVAVLFMDLDNFKYVNDSLGHEAGDGLLTCVAERVRRAVRPADTVARLGGDEFTVLLEDLEDEDGAIRVAERIAVELEGPITVADREVYAVFSIGISMSPAGSDARGEKLLRDADAAMYEAKKKGKDRYQVFEPGMGLRASERLGLESALRRAVGNEELRLHYQPKVLLQSGEVLGAEALVRWEHPERGMIPPGDFIPLAEETGLIVGVGHWVLREACRQAHAWRERYGDRSPSTVWVNLSARQFHRPNLAQEIAAVLEETGLPPEGLGLEITESVLMEYGGATVATLEGLKSLGVKLAVDDFGTGYSSLSYLKRLPVDHLKIDRSFVAGLGKNPEDEVLVSAMINLAQALSLKVIAEGVETAEQLERLTEMGCDLAQGYHFSRPLPGNAASEFLEDRLAS